jgi:hypothetical protein
MLSNIFQGIAKLKTCRIFAVELFKASSVQVLLTAAFFIPAHQTLSGCCFPSDSRCIALLSLPKLGNNNFLLYNNILSSTMASSTKSATEVNNSTLSTQKNNLTKTQLHLLKQVKIQCLKSEVFYSAIINMLKTNEV